ncbi:MAG: zf-HC2 domain-containing protein, partial [Xanthobacteraceae bacterium]
MIDRDQIVGEDELSAYVDGELPADRRAAVEAWIATHLDDAAKVAAWRTQAELIRERYGAVADEAPPQRFNVNRLTRRSYGAIAAA